VTDLAARIRLRRPGPTRFHARHLLGEREAVVDEHRRFLQHPGARPGERQPLAGQHQGAAPAAADDSARWCEAASHRMPAIAAPIVAALMRSILPHVGHRWWLTVALEDFLRAKAARVTG
jgi:hypothetical protein